MAIEVSTKSAHHPVALILALEINVLRDIILVESLSKVEVGIDGLPLHVNVGKDRIDVLVDQSVHRTLSNGIEQCGIFAHGVIHESL